MSKITNFKALILIFSFILCLNLYSVENSIFSLSKEVSQLIQSIEFKSDILSNKNNKALYLKILKKIIDNPEEYDNLESHSIAQQLAFGIVDQNIGWTFIKRFDLESEKINLENAKNTKNADKKTVDHIQRIYDETFSNKLQILDQEIVDKIRNSGIKEACLMLYSFIDATEVISSDINVVKLNNENRDTFAKLILAQYSSEGCGICKKTGADVFWFSRYSRCAHQTCFNLIKDIENNTDFKNNEDFKKLNKVMDNGDLNTIHIEIIELVQKSCGNLTILEYLVQNGTEQLTKILKSANDTIFAKKFLKSKK